MEDISTTGLLVAAVLALWKFSEKLIDKLLEKRAEKNGTSSKVHFESIIERLTALTERMDSRMAKMEEITTARDEEGRPRTWFPEAMIKRTHEAVRNNGEILHEVSKGLNQNGEAIREHSKKIDDLRIAVSTGH